MFTMAVNYGIIAPMIEYKKQCPIRQQKIIDLLHPKKFWRYDAASKQCKNVV
jgi:hypothetical protein